MTDTRKKADEAKEIVNKYALYAAATALVPIPLVHGAIVTGVQLDMLRRLSKLYEVQFKENLGKSLVTSLISGGTTGAIRGLARSVHGWLGFLTVASVSALNSSTTYAVGNVFIQHFESGGTLLTFEPDKVRAFYTKKMDEAPKQVQRAKYAGIKP